MPNHAPYLEVPVLEELTRDAWVAFKQAYRLYTVRGGETPMRSLLSDTVMVHLGLICDKIDTSSIKNDKLAEALGEEPQPATKAEALSLFKEIKYPKEGVSKSSLVKYIAEFRCMGSQLSDAVKPHDSCIVRAFLPQLPNVFRKCAAGDRFNNLAGASKFMLKNVEACVKVQELAGVAKSTDRGGRGGNSSAGRGPGDQQMKTELKSGPEGRPRQPRDMSKVKCYNCNQFGHLARGCPSKEGAVATRTRPKEGSPPVVEPKAAVVFEEDLPEPPQKVRPTPHVDIEVTAVQPRIVSAHLGTGAVNLIRADVVEAIGAKPTRVRPVILQGVRGQRSMLGQGVVVTVTISQGMQVPTVLEVPFFVTPEDSDEVTLGNAWLEDNNLRRQLLDASSVVQSKSKSELQTTDVSENSSVKVDNSEWELPNMPEPLDCGLMEDTLISNSSWEKQIEELREEFHDIFEPLSSQPADAEPLKLEFVPGVPIKSQPWARRISPAVRASLDQQLDELIDKGMIQPTTSNVVSPVVVVKKPGGEYRMCVGYRAVNAATKKDESPLPRIDDLLEKFSGKQIYGRIDLKSGFHQIGMHPESIPYTAFVTHRGIFEYTRCPFGLKNATKHFHNQFQKALWRDMPRVIQLESNKEFDPRDNVSVFVDDGGFAANEFEEYLQTLRAVFQVCRKRGYRLHPKKCVFLCSAMEILGHVVSRDGHTLSKSRRAGIGEIPVPKSQQQVRALLGATNFFRQYVPNYAQIAKPLTILTGKGVKFTWDSKQDRAFQQLIHVCKTAPMLRFIDYSKEIHVQTDASDTGIGAILFQYDKNGNKLPVAFLSKSFDDTQLRWATIEQEAYAIYMAIKSWDCYLAGAKFIVETDHRNLLYMQKSQAPKIVRWYLYLGNYDFTLKHIAGKDNVIADGLSRVYPSKAVHIIDDTPSIRGAFDKVHNSLMGHHGVQRTLDEMAKLGIIITDNVRKSVREWIGQCAVCQKTRFKQAKQQLSVHTTLVDQPFTVINVDAIGPLPTDERGFSYIVACNDSATRYTELFPVVDLSAEHFVDVLLQLISRYGMFVKIRSDKSTQFVNEIIEDVCKVLQLEQVFSTPHHPQANGQIERANAEIMRHLRALVVPLKTTATWSRYVPLVARIINSMANRVTGIAPATLLFGDMIDLRRGLVLDFEKVEVKGKSQLSQLKQVQKELWKAANELQAKHIEKRLSEQPNEPTEFEIGQLVLISYPGRPPTKLHPKWAGPYTITARKGNQYTVSAINQGKTIDVHAERIQPYINDPKISDADVATFDDGRFYVEKILGHRGSPKKKSTFELLVKWQGYGEDDNSWEPYANVRGTPQMEEYARMHALRL